MRRVASPPRTNWQNKVEAAGLTWHTPGQSYWNESAFYRFDAREIIPGGPMFGKKMFTAAGAAAEREQAVLQDAGLSLGAFHGFGKLLSGTRRYTLVYVDDLAGDVENEGVRLTFTLPAGSYATVLLRELTHAEGLEGDEE